MKTITFRPLRRVKKTGKITVASYMQWNKVRCGDYNKFTLVVDTEYKQLPLDEFVYDHKGELLYFFDYNPADVPVFQSNKLMTLDEMIGNNKMYGILWDYGGRVNYHMRGADCVGTPTFSHWTADYIADYWKEPNDFEPLTVKTVVTWFGWFLYQLQNSYLQMGK